MTPEIDVFELNRLRKENVDFQLIDVRNLGEFEYSNIGGDLIPINEITQNMEAINTDKKVVIICRSGIRSANVVDYLTKVIGKDIFYNVKGGILAWADEIDSSVKKY